MQAYKYKLNPSCAACHWTVEDALVSVALLLPSYSEVVIKSRKGKKSSGKVITDFTDHFEDTQRTVSRELNYPAWVWKGCWALFKGVYFTCSIRDTSKPVFPSLEKLYVNLSITSHFLQWPLTVFTCGHFWNPFERVHSVQHIHTLTHSPDSSVEEGE